MKYMLIMRATDEADAAFADQTSSFDKILESMGPFNEELISSGVLVAAEGLDDASPGVVVDYSSDPPVVTDGPYGETKELFGGYWILDVASKEEAVEWAKRAPLTGPGMKAEIRRVASIDEFPQDNPWIQKERAWREADRPAVSHPAGAGRGPRGGRGGRRIESAHIVGTLARYTGDFGLAEDVAQEALAGRWSPGRATTCREPGRRLLTVGRVARSTPSGAGRRSTSGTPRSRVTWPRARRSAARLRPAAADDELWDPDRIDDDVLALMFIACHPVLSRRRRSRSPSVSWAA